MGSGGVGPGMMSPQQAMFMQQGMGGPRTPFSQQGGLLQGPLAYLEKTTSNIGRKYLYTLNLDIFATFLYFAVIVSKYN